MRHNKRTMKKPTPVNINKALKKLKLSTIKKKELCDEVLKQVKTLQKLYRKPK